MEWQKEQEQQEGQNYQEWHEHQEKQQQQHVIAGRAEKKRITGMTVRGKPWIGVTEITRMMRLRLQ